MHRRALLPRGLRARARRRLDPRHHVHGARGRRAARAHPRSGCASSAATTWPASSTRLDLDHPRLLPPPAARVSVRRPGSTRASACSTKPGPRAPRRGFPRRARGVLRGDDPERAAAARGLRRHALRRMLTGVHETLRSAGRALVLELGGRIRSSTSASPSSARGSTRTATSVRRVRCAARASRRGPSRCSTSRTVGERRAASYEEARQAVEAAALDALAARDRELLQELLLAFDRAYRAAKDRESALDFEDLQLLARDLLREHEEIREREQLALPLDHGRRVPGHEPAPVRARRPARAPGRRALLRRRRVPVDLPLPARGRRGLPRAPRAGRRRARAHAELPLAARGARRRQLPLRGRLRRRRSSR